MPRRIALVLATLVCAEGLRASQPQFWRIEGSRDFLEGTLEGLSVDSEGRVRLAPEAVAQGDLSSAQTWCVVGDGDGGFYVGTGSEGKVFRVKDGAATLLFDAPELEVHALAVGRDHRVYAGTSPDGKVYAIDSSGQAETFYDPGDKYIWALAFDGSGRLLVATGLEGKVHRVDKKGAAEVILTSADGHLTALATDEAGDVFAGSSPSGIVYRVDPAGKVFVLDDTPYREIKALAAGRDGALYVAAIDGKQKESASPSLAPVALPTVEVTVTETVTAILPSAMPPAPSPTPGVFDVSVPAASKGGLLRIAPSGEVETLWSSSEDSPHSLLLEPEGALLGTGDKGKLFRVRDDRSWSMLAAFPAQQITGIARTKEATMLSLSNPARVYRLGAGSGARGSFTSKVKDTETVSTWGRIRWEASLPAGTEVQLQTRSGNTDNPDATWTEWSSFYREKDGDPVTSARARFLQARALLSGSSGTTPVVDSISTAYLQRNLRPQVQAITIHPPGEVFQKPLSLSGDVEILGLEPAADSPQAQAQASAAKQALAAAASPFSRKLFQKGVQTISWRADDPNGDGLVYDVAYRTLGETRFRTLRTALGDAVLAWDTSTVPNGRYVVRITARDTPGNPESLALSGSKESDPFEIDNTPPTVVASTAAGSSERVRAVATDQDSLIRKAEYSVDGGRWREVHPKDGINDAREEIYEFTPEGMSAGPHTVVVRATDALGNLGTARVEVSKER